MPCIQTKVSLPLSAEQESRLKARFGETIALLPGKTEQWLMCSFEDRARLWFAGTNKEPCALVEVQIFGSAPAAAYDRLTGELTGILQRELGLSPERVYVKYEEIAHWGWNGSNF